MPKERMIKHFNHTEIDKDKWDTCIENAGNSLIYAYSWYLDIVSPNWNALIYGDYEAVMPLPWRRKYGVKYIYKPFFTQQLGVFGKTDNKTVELFLNSIPSKYYFIDYNLNEQNNTVNFVKKVNSNYKLSITSSYEDVLKGYNRNCKRNLKKATQADFYIENVLDANLFVSFVRDNLEEQLDGVGDLEYATLENLIIKTLEKRKAELVGVYDANKELHAVGFFLINKDRIIFSVCASTDFGKRNQAMYFLVDNQIKKNIGKYNWYDFSGSNIKGIAYFNSTFGAEPIPYSTVVINRLPRIVQLLRS